jgi:superfamily II DNA or RNA helicase
VEEKRKALIRRGGFHIQVIPDYSIYLTEPLTYKLKITKGNNANVEFRTIECYKLHENTLLVPAGLTGRVVEILRRENVEVEFEDLRDRILPEPVLDNLPPLREGQDELLAKVISSDHGIIEGPTGSGKSFIIRQICKLWPTANIIICTPAAVGRELLLQTHRDLLEEFPITEVGVVGAGHCDNCRITCVMDRSLHKADLEKCQILIFDEVHHAAAPKTAEALGKVTNARRFGFSASPFGRGDCADLQTEALFGPVIYKSTYQDIQKTGAIVPILVLTFSMQDARPVAFNSTTTALERNGIWRNRDRNDLIASAIRWVRNHFGDSVQILISVKTVEHAVYLGHKLPDFALVYADMPFEKRERWEKAGLIEAGRHPITSSERERLRDDFRAGSLKRVIATQIWGTGVDFPKLEVLVRADAQASSIRNTQLPGRVTRAADGKSFGLVLDFDDCHADTLNGRFRKRLTAYRKKGWTISPVNLNDSKPTLSVT